jgi:hypothetical protein
MADDGEREGGNKVEGVAIAVGCGHPSQVPRPEYASTCWYISQKQVQYIREYMRCRALALLHLGRWRAAATKQLLALLLASNLSRRYATDFTAAQCLGRAKTGHRQGIDRAPGWWRPSTRRYPELMAQVVRSTVR